jgi:uncharacterized protein (TIGR00255 family)
MVSADATSGESISDKGNPAETATGAVEVESGTEEAGTAKGIRSMTGQGNAAGPVDVGNVSVELRTVNNRGFKCSLRVPESLAGYESKIESVVRQYLHRGSINLSINLGFESSQSPVQINEPILASYIRQCQAAMDASGTVTDSGVILNVASLTSLPGVLSGQRLAGESAERLWEQVQSILIEALENLVAMRQREGGHMAESLLVDCAKIRQHVESIQILAPQAAENYRVRLESKVQRVLAEYKTEVNAVDLLREIQIYADKADVSEEITRLDSHLNLFESVLGGGKPSAEKDSQREEPTGRKLDFIIQEMFRETNTIGSKSAQAEVSAVVVEIKCAIERMRELVQNLE